MQERPLGPFSVSRIGLGCMNLSHAYDVPPDEQAGSDLLLKALDLGYTHFDTAALYGFGANETLLGKALSARRDEFVLASKCGTFKNDEGKREINGRPDVLKRTCEDALVRLQTDVIDLYYLHRWDKSIPIEESVGALSELVAEGKVKSLGLSEVSAATLRRAHAVHPIAAVQTEYSLWTRNAEIAVLDACRAIGAAFVAFSPLARGYLTGTLLDVSTLVKGDFRLNMPRFQPDAYAANLVLLNDLAAVANDAGCSLAQLALAWVLAQGGHVHVIPGTRNPAHLAENADADRIELTADQIARAGAIVNHDTVHGPRYGPATQLEIDTEEFA